MKRDHVQVRFWSRVARVMSCDVSARVGSKRLFKGFVTHALNTCVDYNEPRVSYADNDELTFVMDDGLSESCYKEMLTNAQIKHKVFNDSLVVKAFYKAEKAQRT
ncbi:hypothetical protein Tco_1234071, partial [Tanacetum coccineum]